MFLFPLALEISREDIHMHPVGQHEVPAGVCGKISFAAAIFKGWHVRVWRETTRRNIASVDPFTIGFVQFWISSGLLDT